MRRGAWLLMASVGCLSKPGAVTSLPDASVESSSAHVWELTPQVLDGYLAYQRDSLTADARTLPDGGPLHLTPEARANLDDAARIAHGLSEEDVVTLDQMMGPLTAAALLEAPAPTGLTDAKVNAIAERVAPAPQLVSRDAGPPGSQLAEKAMGELKQKFGEKNVALLLTHRDALVDHWLAMMKLPPRPPSPPPTPTSRPPGAK